MYYELDVRTPGRVISVSNRQIRTPFKIKIEKEKLSSLEIQFKKEGITNYTVKEIFDETREPIIIKKVIENQEDPVKQTKILKSQNKNKDEIIEEHTENLDTDIKIIELKNKINEVIGRISKKT